MPATSAALVRARESLARAKARAMTKIARTEIETEKVTHTVIGVATGFMLGRAEARGAVILPGIAGLDYKLVWGIISHLIATQAEGRIADVASGAGDGMLSCYGYAEGLGKAEAAGYPGNPEDQIEV